MDDVCVTRVSLANVYVCVVLHPTQGSLLQGSLKISHPAFATPAVSIAYNAPASTIKATLETIFGANTISVGFVQQWPLPYEEGGPGWNGGYRWVRGWYECTGDALPPPLTHGCPHPTVGPVPITRLCPLPRPRTAAGSVAGTLWMAMA